MNSRLSRSSIDPRYPIPLTIDESERFARDRIEAEQEQYRNQLADELIRKYGPDGVAEIWGVPTHPDVAATIENNPTRRNSYVSSAIELPKSGRSDRGFDAPTKR